MKPLLSITSLLAALVMLSVTAPQAAAQATTTTTLAASPNPIITGKQVTFTVTVQTTGSSPLTGFVDLSINGNFTPGLGLVNGVATTAIPFNTVGTYVVVATYTGDPNNANSSAKVSVAVQAALGLSPTTITVATSVNPAEVDRSGQRGEHTHRNGQLFLWQRRKSGSGDAGEQRDGYGEHRLPERRRLPDHGYLFRRCQQRGVDVGSLRTDCFGGCSRTRIELRTRDSLPDSRHAASYSSWTLQRSRHRQQSDAQLSHTTERVRHSIDSRCLFT
jgi:hypothetical protein